MVSNNPIADDSWPDSLYEPSINSTTFFSGARVAVVDGVAHLMFYIEQPTTQGGTEFVVVARMMAPMARATSVLASLAARLSHGAPADLSTRVNEDAGEIRH
jgi:hypothetical protein